MLLGNYTKTRQRCYSLTFWYASSKHSTLRTRIKRLVRRTICFAKTEQRHALVIGLFVSMIMSPCTTMLGPRGTRCDDTQRRCHHNAGAVSSATVVEQVAWWIWQVPPVRRVGRKRTFHARKAHD